MLPKRSRYCEWEHLIATDINFVADKSKVGYF